jgi:hypothetical protein
MPVIFNWKSVDILHVKYVGIIDGNDAVQASLRMSSDPRFDNLKGIIIDTLEITENIATSEHIDRLVSLSRIMSKSNPRVRNALVLNQDENTEALATLYTVLANDLIWKVEMFQTMDHARYWILNK